MGLLLLAWCHRQSFRCRLSKNSREAVRQCEEKTGAALVDGPAGSSHGTNGCGAPGRAPRTSYGFTGSPTVWVASPLVLGRSPLPSAGM